jgi:hypothetical protein
MQPRNNRLLLKIQSQQIIFDWISLMIQYHGGIGLSWRCTLHIGIGPGEYENENAIRYA